MNFTRERIAIIDGIRTPMAKAGGPLKNTQADDLGAYIVRQIIERNPIAPEEFDEVIIGNVAQPAHAANISRVIALKAGLPNSVPAYTVHRNCASGMESMTTAASKLIMQEGDIYLAGGAESMSNIPLFFNKDFTSFMERMMRSKTFFQKLGTMFSFNLGMLKPEIGVMHGLTDPVSGLIMGLTAENLAKEFNISRQEQDELALLSHQRAARAAQENQLEGEVIPVPIMPTYKDLLSQDFGPRANQTMEALGKLRPYFDKKNGTVTIGNACPITDGAAAVIMMRESDAKKRGLEPLGYLTDWAYAGLEPERMGLGPTYATAKLFKRAGVKLSDIDYIEMNEAFAAQIIGNERAFASREFAKKYLDMDAPLGEIDRDKMNLQGGAIALGHPVGVTGTRIAVHTLRELRRQGKNTGLATLCIGGGQGGSLLLEVA
jgi:acetyl-CoA acetyltransferase family protein